MKWQLKIFCFVGLLYSTFGFGQYTGDSPDNYDNDANRARRASQKQDEDFAAKNRAPNEKGITYKPLSAEELKGLNNWWESLKNQRNTVSAPGTPGGGFTKEQQSEFEIAGRKRIQEVWYVNSIISRYHTALDKGISVILNEKFKCVESNCENGKFSATNATTERIGTFENGKLQGVVSFYFQDPLLRSILLTYENGILNGPGTAYFHDGTFENLNFSYNHFGGENTIVFPNKESAFFLRNDGKITGVLRYQYEKGYYSRFLYRDDKLFTLFSAFHSGYSFNYPSSGMYNSGYQLYIDEQEMTKIFDNDGTGAFYAGNFNDRNRLEGMGHRTWKSGTNCYGNFTDGSCNGDATFYYNDGAVYIGKVKKSSRNGLGTVKYTNGTRYTGAFKDGQKSGKGKIFFANGQNFSGDFKDDEITGNGVFDYDDGYVYKGPMRTSMRNGKGVITRTADGYYIKGTFTDDAYTNVVYYNNDSKAITKDVFYGRSE